jgi:lipopolysaccharide export LptBFGC system permease protein LptF
MKTLLTILLTIGLSATIFAGNNTKTNNNENIRKEVFVKKIKRNKVIVNEIIIKNNKTLKGEKKVYNKQGKLLRSKTIKTDKVKLMHQNRQNLSLRLPFSDRLKSNPKYRA